MDKTALVAAIVAASIFVIVTPAHAKDNPRFDGPWVGATAGYDGFTAGEGDGDDTQDDIAYGIALGYDLNLGGVVIGAEAELTDSAVSATSSDLFEAEDRLTISAGRDIYAGARIGVPVSDTMLLFAKAGYTNQRFNAVYTLDGSSETFAENVDGFRLGGGGELSFGQPFARIEYRYSEYGTFSDTDLETSRHQVMLSAGLRF